MNIIDYADTIYGGDSSSSFDIGEFIDEDKGKVITPVEYAGGSIVVEDEEKLKDESKVFTTLKLGKSICNPVHGTGDTMAPCSSSNVLQILDNFTKKKGISMLKGSEKKISSCPILNRLADYTKCDNEKCILLNSEVKEELQKEGVSSSEIMDFFKAEGPRETDDWLSDKNIHDVLNQYKKEYPEFDYYPCCLMDFDKVLEENGAEAAPLLAKKSVVDFIREGKKKIACIPNTGVGRSRGIHWVTLFVDVGSSINVWSVEYFNSTGQPPTKEFNTWLNRAYNDLKNYARAKGLSVEIVVKKNSTVMQTENSECGVYSLYYVRSRLEGRTFEEITSEPIKDDSMILFRRYLFSPESKKYSSGGRRGGGRNVKEGKFYKISAGMELIPINL